MWLISIFTQNLAHFVRTHERALANVQLQRTRTQSTASASASSASVSLADAVARPYVSFTSPPPKPAKLCLTPHHLFYLLTKFEELGVDVGPTNVRLENLQSDAAPSNYVSFLGHAPKSKGKQSDADSLKSVSSVRSVMSSVSSIWSSFSISSSTAKEEKRMAQHREDIRYLYSCFTKIPALKLAPDHRARLVRGFEEFPFDTAVPLFVFKNVSRLEISDLDFRQFHGWDRISEQLRTLVVKRGYLDDPIDLLLHIVLDDMERRRKRSSKTSQQAPPTPSTPGLPWPALGSSPKHRNAELARSYSTPNSPLVDQRRSSLGAALSRAGSSEGAKQVPAQHRQRSISPARPPSSRHGSLHKARRGTTQVYRRSSGSSGSSGQDVTPRHSTSDLLAMNYLPPSKWCMLRHLGLPDNGLTSLTAESLRPVAGTLQSLDLSDNLFTEIPDALASLTHLRALNLGNCMIDSLKSLTRYPLPAISTLNLQFNRLLSLVGIEKIPTLERIDLRGNKLYDPTEIRRLTTALDLMELYVQKNPFVRTHSDYRIIIFNIFRDTPGHQADLIIDSYGPNSAEKKLLHDKAPEPPPVPVVQPSPEVEPDEDVLAGAAAELRLEPPALEPRDAVSHGPTHRRSTSELGPRSMRRKKNGTRRRIVELSQQESLSSSPAEPSLLHASGIPPKTPIEAREPSTPGPTPYHTAPTTQMQSVAAGLPRRPAVNTAFSTPAPSPKIREASDDDDSPLKSPDAVEPSGDLYRQKIEVLKQDFGPNWLAALNEDRLAEQQRARNQSPSPLREVSVGGRTLG